MFKVRSGRRVALGTAFVATLMAASVGSQTVFVDVKAGDDRNLGRTPETSVQTITRALGIASANLTVPWTIRVAGRVDEEGALLAYDEDPCTSPPSRECFPLPMLRGVSLVWDQENSDVVSSGPDFEGFAAVRPLVRSTSGPTMLVELSPSPGARAVCSPVLEPFDPTGGRLTLSGLGFEGGEPGDLDLGQPPRDCLGPPAGPGGPGEPPVRGGEGVTVRGGPRDPLLPLRAFPPLSSRYGAGTVPHGRPVRGRGKGPGDDRGLHVPGRPGHAA